MPFCPNCGAEIKDLSQNFCENCGTQVPESMKMEETVTTPMQPTTTTTSRQGGLFDINRNYYILKEKYWDI